MKKYVTLWKKNISTFGYFIKMAYGYSKGYIPLQIVCALLNSVPAIVNVVCPKYIIDGLLDGEGAEYFAFYISIIVISNVGIGIVRKYIGIRMSMCHKDIMNRFEERIGKKIMNMEYRYLEEPEILNMKDQAIMPINSQGIIGKMFATMQTLVETIVTMAGLTAVILTLDAYVLIFVLLVMLINTKLIKCSERVQYETFQKMIPHNREFKYYAELATRFEQAKEIRIYDMKEFILNAIDAFNAKSMNMYRELFTRAGRYDVLKSLLLVFQEVVLYGYMAVRVFAGKIGIGDYVMYISAARKVSQNMSELFSIAVQINQLSKYLEITIAFDKLCEISNEQGEIPSDSGDIEIEFRDVWFKYPNANEYALQDINLKMAGTERISIVGENGSGKTTFIKLLCRLYSPEKGEILVNGKDINKYSYEEYMKLISVIFQDYKLFSLSIKDNLVFGRDIDREKIMAVLDKAGIRGKIETLPKQENTVLFRRYDKEAVELSGGELQKLAIARSIMKSAPVVIMDEPTSALDPIAEYEVFNKMEQLSSDSLAIFISHRLSSCKTSDRIVVFKNGRIIESGTHKELIKLGGKYSEMWKVQAQYYMTAGDT